MAKRTNKETTATANNSALALAKAELLNLHTEATLYYDRVEDMVVSRKELPLPSLNYILSGRYTGPDSGFALGKLYNFFGMESCGKSSLAEQIVGWLNADNMPGMWCDAERSFDAKYAKKAFGIDYTREDLFHLIIPDYGEQAFDAINIYVKSGAVNIVVCDSVSALGTQRTYEAENGKDSVGELARRLSRHLEGIVGPANDNKCSIIYINQMRENIVSMGGMMKSIGRKYTGGNAMKFYPHTALKFSIDKELYDSKDQFIGLIVTIFGDKNKLGVPFLKESFLFIPGEGFSIEADKLNLAVKTGVVIMKGNYYYYGEQSLGNGLNMARLKLKAKPELLEEIWQKTRPYLLEKVDLQTGELLDVES